eukprot:1094079-Rhodomonas_salina.1
MPMLVLPWHSMMYLGASADVDFGAACVRTRSLKAKDLLANELKVKPENIKVRRLAREGGREGGLSLIHI